MVAPASSLPLTRLAELFVRAYAGYPFEVRIDAVGLERFIRERTVHLSLSRVEPERGLALVGLRKQRGYLATLGVVPEARGTGLAGELLEGSLDALAKAGARTCVLEVLEENARARRFYEKHGFVGRRRFPCYRSGPLVPRNTDIQLSSLAKIAPRYRRDAAWQNELTTASALGARAYEGRDGYAVVAMGFNGAVLLDVNGPDPGAVLDGLALHYRDTSLNYVNVPTDDVVKALEARGWKRYTSQVEMVRTL